MTYLYILKNNKFKILPMSAFVAWLWAFPLFGFLQEWIFPAQLISHFTISYLVGTAAAYLITAFIRNRQAAAVLVRLAPTVNLMLTITLGCLFLLGPVENFYPPSLSNLYYLLLIALVPAVMGAGTALFFVSWGVTIVSSKELERGRYMALMMAVAAVIYLVTLLIFLISPEASFFFCAALLLLPSILSSYILQAAFLEKENNQPVSPSVKKEPFPWTSFWLPLTFILASYYLISWITHQTIFPFIRESLVAAPALGNISYGIIALAGGYFLDRKKELEYMAIIGLLFLGFTFLFLPAAVGLQLLLPLQILLDGSYALIDLFIWVLLASAAGIFKGQPAYYYSIGLFLNIFFIIAGIGLSPLLSSLTEEREIFYLSSIAAAVIFCGVLPALSLRKMRNVKEGSRSFKTPDMEGPDGQRLEEYFLEEQLTPKEKEVVLLIMSGLDNSSIQTELNITRNTLKTHIRHIYGKAGVKNRTELLFRLEKFNK